MLNVAKEATERRRHPAAPPVGLDAAVAEMLSHFDSNRWFVEQCWPGQASRVRWMCEAFLEQMPPSSERSILDVGCFNGAHTFLLRRLGYQVCGADAERLDDRTRLFEEAGIDFFFCNLNEPNPFARVPDASVDGVNCSEVFEHILNHPIGLLQEMSRVLKAGGTMVLTTPNPATLINALRLLGNRDPAWGTDAILREVKIRDGRVTTRADIHYREYTAPQLRAVLEEVGFQVVRSAFMAHGSGVASSGPKVLAKKLLKPLLSTRLFGATQLHVLRKRA